MTQTGVKSRGLQLRWRAVEVQKPAHSMQVECFAKDKFEPPVRTSGSKTKLTIPRHCTQLPGKEVVRRPWSADGNLTVFQLLGRRAVAVLIFLDRFGIDEMGNVDKHALWSDLLAAHFFFQRVKQLVDLHRKGARLGL